MEKKHPNNLSSYISCDNVLIPKLKSKTVFKTIVNARGALEVIVLKTLHENPDVFVEINGKWSLRK